MIVSKKAAGSGGVPVGQSVASSASRHPVGGVVAAALGQRDDVAAAQFSAGRVVESAAWLLAGEVVACEDGFAMAACWRRSRLWERWVWVGRCRSQRPSGPALAPHLRHALRHQRACWWQTGHPVLGQVVVAGQCLPRVQLADAARGSCREQRLDACRVTVSVLALGCPPAIVGTVVCEVLDGEAGRVERGLGRPSRLCHSQRPSRVR